MAFCKHTSQALASAKVNFPDVFVSLTRAHDKPGPDRLAELQEARGDVLAVLAEIDKAIEREAVARAVLVGDFDADRDWTARQ